MISASHLTDHALLTELGKRLCRARLRRNMTQAELAHEAGLSKRTIERIEAGHSTQMANFLRVCRALDLLASIDLWIPEPQPSPVELLKLKHKERQRASSRRQPEVVRQKPAPDAWTWGDDE